MQVYLSDSLELIDLRRTLTDLSTIENRRFMYHLDGWLILGAEDVVSSKGAYLLKSHAEEYHEAVVRCSKLPPFDSFIRGWIGVGGAYKKGIIHFAPNIPANNIEMFEKAFSFIETALENGFTKNAVLRGFPGAWEQPIQNILPDVKEPLDQQIIDAQNKPKSMCWQQSGVTKNRTDCR